MRRILGTCSVLAMLTAILTLVASAQDQAKSWTGWISDSGCRVKGMSASHKSCANMCVKTAGVKWVLVDSGSREVLNINNQDAVDPGTALGHEVKATGHLKRDGSIDIDNIKPAHAK
jgi:hypothetical protein